MENTSETTENYAYNVKKDDFTSKKQEACMDELEGIVSNEPNLNKYETVKFHKLNVFPYFLIGKIISKFNFDGVNKYLNGVGILVGPDVVLTVAHNLCHMVSKDKLLMTKKVCFFPAASGDFNLFEPCKSIKTYVPEAYLTSLKTDNKDEQLYNDWGLVFLDSPIGSCITNLLDIEVTDSSYLKVVDRFYSFFENNQNLNLLKIAKQTKSEKISIVGYTEFKDNYRNNSAYRFVNNFTKKHEEHSSDEMGRKKGNNSNSKNISANQIQSSGFLQDIVNEKDLMKIQDKKININININTTNPESVTEGLISTSRYYNKMNTETRAGQNGVDYVILGNEDYSKEFDTTDKDKLIMCESQGNLKGLNLDIEEDDSTFDQRAIKYQISTYKGQSGSPLFMRIKRITDKEGNSGKNKPSYIYQFIGLHSRRGPSMNDDKFYESEKMNSMTENMMTSHPPGEMNPALLKKQKLISQDQPVKVDSYENEIVKVNGMCEYNMALSIMGETIKTIKSITGNYPASTTCQDNTLKSDYIHTKIILNDNVRLSGLFKRNVPLSILFSLGADLFKVPKEYILLRDMSHIDIPHIQNYNFDSEKKLSEIMEDPEEQIAISFELMLNIKKYGEIMSEKILQKYLENYDLEINQMKKDFEKKHMKALFHSIFAEINGFDCVQLTYGKLFKKIRKTILTKLGFNV